MSLGANREQAYWNLWDFYSSVLDKYWSPGTRTLVFLGAAIQVCVVYIDATDELALTMIMTQAFATFVTNITSNSIPVGCDLAGLFPRYFTIVRGQVVCFLLAWVCGTYTRSLLFGLALFSLLKIY